MLSDARIRRRLDKGDLKIAGLPKDGIPGRSGWRSYLQPASVDVRLDRHFAVMGGNPLGVIDPIRSNDDLFKRVELGNGETFVLAPGQCALASTFERFTLPNDLLGQVHGKSSIGRLFLQTHCTAGLLDPGWRGYITLELTNLSPYAWVLRPGMRIAQVTFDKAKDVARAYGARFELGSHYQDQPRGPVLPKQHQGFTFGLPTDPKAAPKQHVSTGGVATLDRVFTMNAGPETATSVGLRPDAW